MKINLINFRKLSWRTLITFIIFVISGYFSFSQTVTELVVPKYIGAKNASGINNERTPFAVCYQIMGLDPNQVYDVKTQLGLVTEASTVWGAGNVWDPISGSFSGNTVVDAFTTNASGSAIFWIYYQPTGNSSRFGAGQQHNLRLGWRPSGGSFPSNPQFVGSKIITALDIAPNATTPETTDDGAYIKGTANPAASGKFVLLFDNVNGTGDPLFSYQIRQALPVNTNQSMLNPEINDIYLQAGTSIIGDYPAVVPISANNPNGIRRIESRNDDNAIYAFSTDADGIWPSGANTTNMNRLDIRYITMTDAPLIPQGIPTVTTVATTNITYNSATSGGTVTAAGGSSVSARGVCWSTSPNPTIAGSHTTNGSGLGTFTSQITDLEPITTYYVRAYATNTYGTAYGNEETFTTLTAPYPPIIDFVASSTNINVGNTVNFTDLSTNGPTSWSWSFVGGIPPSSNQQNPSGILYSYPGEYTVCLTASNQYGSNTLCKDAYINVHAPIEAKIVITEIMYNPPETGTDSLEFIELFNNGASAIDLEGFYFSEGVTYTFPSYLLAPGAYAVVAVNSQAMQNTFGISTLQWSSGALNNSGELIRLKDKYGYTVDSVYYDDALPWDTLADGWGPSLTLCNPDLDNSLAENWTHSMEFVTVNANGDSIWATPGGPCIIPVLPVADFVGNPLSLMTGESVQFTDLSTGPNITNWEWIFDGGTPATFSGQNPPPIYYYESGLYDVTLKVTNEFGTSTAFKPEYITVLIDAIGDDISLIPISIQPNPSTGKVNIKHNQGKLLLEVFNLVGEKVYSQELNPLTQDVDLTPLQKGIYFMRFTNDNGVKLTHKLILK